MPKRFLFLTILILLLATSLHAQEQTDEAPPPTNTLLPSLTPTETATLLPSETTTATFTDTPTLTASPEATSELYTPTETPTAQTGAIETLTPSLTPSLTALPTQADLNLPGFSLLYNESLTGGDPFRKLHGGSWSVAGINGNFALQATVNSPALLVGTPPYSDVVFQANVQVNAGNVRLNVRQGAAGRYSLTLDAAGLLTLHRGDVALTSVVVNGFLPGQWHTLRLQAIGNTLRAFVDGVEVITLQDSVPLPAGLITFAAENVGSSTLLVDDLALWVAEAETGSTSNFAASAFLSPHDAFAAAITSNEWLLGSRNLDEFGQPTNDKFKAIFPELPPPVPTLANLQVYDFEWSPNGQWVIFECWSQTSPYDICLMNSSGTQLFNLTNSPNVYDSSPTWRKPSGDMMAFRSDRTSGGTPSVSPAIWAMDLTNIVGGINSTTTEGFISGGQDDPAWWTNGTTETIYYPDTGIKQAQFNGFGGSVSISQVTSEPYDSLPVVVDGQLYFRSAFIDPITSAWGYRIYRDPVQRILLFGGQQYEDVFGYDVTSLNVLMVHSRINLDHYVTRADDPDNRLIVVGGSFGFDITLLLQGQPTPTPTSNPEEAYYEQFIGIMFWAIYNETNANQSADRNDITSPEHTPIYDHRYLMAWAMISHIPLDDIEGGVDYMKNWKGSIGNPTYDLWTIQGVNKNIKDFTETPGEEDCSDSSGLIGFYKDKVEDSEILRWFNGYADCFRANGGLEGNITDFDTKYDEITQQIRQAIQDYLSTEPFGENNPIPGAGYVKTTSKCYVWNRDSATQFLTSCRASRPDAPINMQEFCAQQPNRPTPQPPTPIATNRNCRTSDHNVDNVNVAAWLGSIAALDATQQLGLETTVNATYFTSLGFYTPDQPIFNPTTQMWTSGQGCETNCYFLIQVRTQTLSEDLEQSWVRHYARFTTDPGYAAGSPVMGIAHVLRTEPQNGPQTWITFVYQANP